MEIREELKKAKGYWIFKEGLILFHGIDEDLKIAYLSEVKTTSANNALIFLFEKLDTWEATEIKEACILSDGNSNKTFMYVLLPHFSEIPLWLWMDDMTIMK